LIPPALTEKRLLLLLLYVHQVEVEEEEDFLVLLSLCPISFVTRRGNEASFLCKTPMTKAAFFFRLVPVPVSRMERKLTLQKKILNK